MRCRNEMLHREHGGTRDASAPSGISGPQQDQILQGLGRQHERSAIDIALAVYQAAKKFRTQAEAARKLKISPSLFYWYRRAGEALTLLSDSERKGLYGTPADQTQTFRDLAGQTKSPYEFSRMLLEASRGVEKTHRRTRPKKGAGAKAQGRRTGDGERLVIEWSDEDLLDDPEIISRLADTLLSSLEKMVARANELSRQTKRETTRKKQQRQLERQSDRIPTREPALSLAGSSSSSSDAEEFDDAYFDDLLKNFDQRRQEILAKLEKGRR